MSLEQIFTLSLHSCTISLLTLKCYSNSQN